MSRVSRGLRACGAMRVFLAFGRCEWRPEPRCADADDDLATPLLSRIFAPSNVVALPGGRMSSVCLLKLGRLGVLVAAGWLGQVPASAMVSAGGFDVSQGVASYSIPIKLPAGLGDAQPSLALSYSSAAGNGLLGMGWALSGLSSISRCAQTLAQDGVIRAVGNDASDRFCLNGQRLFATSGTYGAAGAEYRTEQESFTKIISDDVTVGGPSSFTVKTKDGLTIHYGKTTDSKIEVAGGSVVAEWAVNKVTDTIGNSYSVSYNEINADGNYYPSRIDYSANSSAGVAPAYAVLFDYESRPDVRISYRGGAVTKQTLRLKAVRIQTAAGAELRRVLLTYSASPQQVVGGVFTALASVQECAGTSCMPAITFGWKPAVSNAWSQNLGYLLPEAMFADMKPEVGVRLADLNGDGLPDFVASRWISAGEQTRKVYLNTGSSFVPAQQFILPEMLSVDPVTNGGGQLIDLNGDGLLDFIIARYTGGTPIVKTWLNTGASSGVIWQEAPSYALPAGYALTSDQKANIGAQLIDLNGDGLPDFVASRWISAGNMTRLALINTGSGWAPAPNYILPEMLAVDPVENGGGQLVDLNGDGLVDFIIARYTGGTPIVKSWLNVGNGTGASSTGTVWQESTEYKLPANVYLTADMKANVGTQLIDLNGDGLPDFVASRWIDANNQTRLALLNTGKGWVTANQYILPEMLSADPVSDVGARLIDLNGDGLPDFIHSRNATGTPLKGAWLNTGNGWTPAAPAKVDAYVLPEYLSYDPMGSGIGAMMLDLNGDGLPDFVSSRWTGSSLIRNTLINQTPKLLLSEIRNGLSSVTTISYKELPRIFGGAYKREKQSQYPGVYSVNPMSVVVDVINSNGVGGSSQTSYSYGNFKSDIGPYGRGDLGFEWVHSQNVQTGSVKRTYFRQDWPYLGLVSEAGTGTGVGPVETNWKNLTHTVNTAFTCRAATGSGAWAPCTTPSPNTRYFIYPNQFDTQAWEYTGMNSSDGVFIALPRTRTTQSLNDYGEVTQLKTETLNPDGSASGYSKTTTNTYAPVDPAKWYLNRLVRSTVTATSP